MSPERSRGKGVSQLIRSLAGRATSREQTITRVLQQNPVERLHIKGLGKLAVVIIDVEEDFFTNGRLREHRSTLTKSINELTSFAREQNIPVIWVRQEFKPDLSDAYVEMRRTHSGITIQNTTGSQLLGELHTEPTDHEVIKKRYSAFFRTNLDELLEELGIDTLIVGGVTTQACIRAAVVDAYQRDYGVMLATNCIDSNDEEHHYDSLRYLTKRIASAGTNQEIFGKFSKK